MAIKTSTGLRTGMLGGTGFNEAMTLGSIKIYSGTPPATADAAPTGTLLCTITNNSTATGLTFATPSGGTILKASAETWSGNNVASGTAGYYRLVSATDTGALSTTEARVQGTVSTSGGDMNLSDTALVSGAPQRIDFYSFTLPTE